MWRNRRIRHTKNSGQRGAHNGMSSITEVKVCVTCLKPDIGLHFTIPYIYDLTEVVVLQRLGQARGHNKPRQYQEISNLCTCPDCTTGHRYSEKKQNKQARPIVFN